MSKPNISDVSVTRVFAFRDLYLSSFYIIKNIKGSVQLIRNTELVSLKSI